jgi:hypothetical protein
MCFETLFSLFGFGPSVNAPTPTFHRNYFKRTDADLRSLFIRMGPHWQRHIKDITTLVFEARGTSRNSLTLTAAFLRWSGSALILLNAYSLPNFLIRRAMYVKQVYEGVGIRFSRPTDSSGPMARIQRIGGQLEYFTVQWYHWHSQTSSSIL